MCMYLAWGGVEVEAGEWMRELALVFTSLVGNGGLCDVCLCLGCSGVGIVDGEWVWAWIMV